MSDGIDTILVKTASRCNIDCSYCYVYRLGDTGWRSQPAVMSERTIDAVVHRLCQLREKQDRDFAVVLHGGEPLLLGEARLTRLLSGLRSHLPAECTLAVQTNGLLITEPILDLFASTDTGVSVSIDGPVELNDSRRMGANGSGTFLGVVRGIRRIQAHSDALRLFSGTLSVVEPSSDPAEVYWFLRRLGVPGMDFLLPDGNHSRTPPGKSSFESTEAGEWLAELFDVYMADPDPVPVRVLDDLVKLALGGTSAKEGLGLSSPSILIIETDGSVAKNDTLKSSFDGADRFDESWTVHEHSLIEITRTKGFRDYVALYAPTSDACSRCPVLRICGGGMPLHRWSDENGYDNPSVYCADHRFLIDHVQSTVEAQLAPT